MGSGTISFGLVNIPVKVYSANESSGKISFNQLHSERKTRLKQQMYDPETGEIVPRDKIVKGYEYAKDQYIVFGEDDRLIPNAFLHGGRARGVFESGAAQIPGAKLQGIDNCGHSVQLDCPVEYGAAVEAFLAGLPAQ